MAYSYVTYTGDGSTRAFVIPFGYINKTDITVAVDGIEVDATVSGSTVTCDEAPEADSAVVVRRTTKRTAPEVTFQDGVVNPASVLNKQAKQAIYLAQEILDGASVTALESATILFGTAAARPSAGTANRAYFATDTGVISIDDGATWNNSSLPAFTGDVTKGLNSVVTSIAAGAVGATELATNAVTAIKIVAKAITLAKMDDLAQNKILGRQSSGTGTPEAITCTDLGFDILATSDAEDLLDLIPAAPLDVPAISVHRNNVDQSGFASATYTKVEHTTEEWDVGSAYDNVTNFRWTPQKAGRYLVRASVEIENLADTKYVNSAIFKNGTIYKRGRAYSSDAGEDTVASVECEVQMNGTTDYLEHFLYHNHGSDRTLQGDTPGTFFQGRWIGE